MMLAADTPTEIFNFESLQTTINNASSDLDLKLSDSYVESSGTLTIANHYNITMDLNGKMLDGGEEIAIDHAGSGILTITDSSSEKTGKITSKKWAIQLSSSDGSLVVTGGTVHSEESVSSFTPAAIYNYSSGSVSIEGGTVTSVGAAIYNNSGRVSVSGGKVTGDQYGINNFSSYSSPDSVSVSGGEVSGAWGAISDSSSSGKISVSGGKVTSTHANYPAIGCSGGGRISISGEDTIVTSENERDESGTIELGGSAGLEITGGTIENTSATGDGNAIYNNADGDITISGGIVNSTNGIGIAVATGKTGKIIISNGGTPTIKGGGKAMNKAPDLSRYVNVKITASTTATDGSDVSEITKADIDTDEKIAAYKYLTFEPAPAVTEQIDLSLGGTYYFDLSSEKDGLGSVNSSLPDTTLHYVPFTYVGTVNAYSLTSELSTTQDFANANTSDRSLFVGDYNISTSITWNALNVNGLIFGKTFDTHYKLRTLSAGSSRMGSAEDGSDHLGQPGTNEWDQIVAQSNGTWIKNITGSWSWGQDTDSETGLSRAIRGNKSVHCWDCLTPGATAFDPRFRPALEVLPDKLESDGLKAVTLNLNSGSLKGSTESIQIICAGDRFTAPSGEGLTAPTGKAFAVWKDAGSSTIYEAGDEVPSSVTGLTAQWADCAAQNTATNIGYATLQEAVNAVDNDQTIKLLTDMTLTDTVTISGDKSFTLDLNGKKISNKFRTTTVEHNGSGTLKIQDDSSSGIIENTWYNQTTIEITAGGSLTLLSGTIRSGGRAIDNRGAGNITVSGGTVTSDGLGVALNNAGSGNVTISGGTVESTSVASTAYAIARAYGSTGKIIISGTANIVAQNMCIFMNGEKSSDPAIEITGGTLTHTGDSGYVIDAYLKNTILVTGGTLESTQNSIIGHTYAYGSPLASIKINIPDGGSAIFKAGEKMLTEGYALTLENAGVKAASEEFDGTPVSTYDPDNIGNYKYLEFGPASTVDVLDLAGQLTAPVKNETPITSINTTQYTGVVAWSSSPEKFLGGTVYTATITLTAKPGYTFSGLGANSFTLAGASSVTHDAGSGNTLTVAVTFPKTSERTLASIAVTTPPTKTIYKYGESFDPTGMVVKATYDDDTENQAFTDYDFSPKGTLNMGNTTITLTANGTSITTTQTITVTKTDGPAAPSVSFSFDGGVSAGKLMGATAAMEYSLDGGSIWADCTPDMDLTGQFGSIKADKDILVRVKEADTHLAGSSQTIDITQPSKPTIGKTDETLTRNDGTITGVNSLMEYKKSGDASYTPISSSTVTGLAPGTYLVRIKATGTALASEDAEVTIAAFVKATPTTADLVHALTAVDYDGSAKNVTVTASPGKNLGAITIRYNGSTTPPINAGIYTVTVDIAESEEYKAVSGLFLGSFAINKIAYSGTKTLSANVVSGQVGATVTLPGLPQGAGYGTPSASGGISMTDMSISGNTLTYTAPVGSAGQTGTIMVPVTGATNYNNYNIIVTVTYIAKTPQNIFYAETSVDKTYGDGKFTNPLTETTVTGTITYASDDISVATVDAVTGEVTIIGSGIAFITATAVETSTHAQATASYTVTVAQKALTLTADDKSMTKGDGVPVFTYTATGLVNGDAVLNHPEMSVSTDGNTVGTFVISISGGTITNSASYDITYTNGTLTVAERYFTVTVTNGTGSGSYAEGAAVTITANDRSGYIFTEWSSADVTFANATEKTTTFTMPAKAVSVTANYRPKSSGGGSSGSGSSGSGDSSPSDSNAAPVSPSKTFVSDTTLDFSVNSAYQFKITSTNGAVPSLVVGTPGIFETQLVRTSGNDYYIKLTAIGKPGDKAGIYVNGVKLLVATVGTTAFLVQSDTTGAFKISKGKTYVFKLTSNSKPSLICGNSSVFQVKLVKQSGKDYFYQATPVGKAGQAAGFYINSSHTPVAIAYIT
ncbi:InlB B-repeat-containing protein [Caproiciproducens sp. LBM24188]